MGKQTRDYNDGWSAGHRVGASSLPPDGKQTETDLAAFALFELAAILDEKVGYLRVGAGRDGLYWVRYKWTQGSLVDHYTLTSDHILETAISTLCVRIRECEMGRMKATFDHPYRVDKSNHKG